MMIQMDQDSHPSCWSSLETFAIQFYPKNVKKYFQLKICWLAIWAGPQTGFKLLHWNQALILLKGCEQENQVQWWWVPRNVRFEGILLLESQCNNWRAAPNRRVRNVNSNSLLNIERSSMWVVWPLCGWDPKCRERSLGVQEEQWHLFTSWHHLHSFKDFLFRQLLNFLSIRNSLNRTTYYSKACFSTT
jgi:hypothetical protein